MNTSSAFSSLAAYAFNNSGSSGSSSSYNQNSLAFNNKNIYASSVTQFLNQSIYEPIEDDDNFSHISTTFPLHDSIASTTFNYDYYQSQTSMDPETCNSFESAMPPQQGKAVAKNLADVAEAHEQSLKLFRESFDLGGGGVRPPHNNIDSRRKHQKSKKYKNQAANESNNK